VKETEHRKMEKVIRHRLRQISLDESDSISDIAKLVVTELNLTEEEQCGHYEEDNDELHSSSESMIQKLQTPFDITIGGSSSDAESPQCTILKLDTLVMIQTKFGFHWSSTFRGEDFLKSI
jgi:hypothetical protein